MSEPVDLRMSFAEVIDQLAIAPQRMPVARIDRDRRLPDWLRDAVLKRDRFLCRWCGNRSAAPFLHIDHITPWSAGGGNESTNLRVLCEDCNETRSNTYTDASTARAMPVTHSCHNCRRTQPADEAHAHAFCLVCSRTTQVPVALIERSLDEQRKASA